MEIQRAFGRLATALWDGIREIGTEHNRSVQRKLIPQVSNYLVEAKFNEGMIEFITNMSALKSTGLAPEEIQAGITSQISKNLNITEEEALKLVLKNTGMDQFESFDEFKAAYDK